MALWRTDGSYTGNLEERTSLLLETHFPGCTTSESTKESNGSLTSTKESWQIARKICTTERVKWAIKSFQPYKSAGIDGIFPILLQKGIGNLLPFLVNIFRSSLALGYIPEKWRRAKVTFLPKAGKKDCTSPKAFRPICLTSFLLKTVEKMVDTHIKSTALEKAPLHPNQHAYRAGKSTETALHQLTVWIQEALNHNETIICAFLDIEGAFDNTPHKAVKDALTDRGVDNITIRWIHEMLTSRAVESQTGGNTTKVNTTRGCPQGGVLSPLLWNLVVDGLLTRLTNLGLTCQGYADDIVIIARGKFEHTLCELIQRGLTETRHWCLKVGLSINPAKTTLVAFTKRRLLPNLKQITINGTLVEWKQEAKYLGVILDSKLKWHKHLEATESKAIRTLMMCRNIAGKNWGCTPKILRWMYTMMVRPIITYGAVAWAGRTKLQGAKSSLAKIQRLACLCITGAMKSCPTAAMEVILDLTPLHLVIEQIRTNTLVRLNRTSRQANCHNLLTPQLGSYMEMPNDGITKKLIFERNFSTVITGREDWSKGSKPEAINNYTLWYVDGSKNSHGTGIGIWGPSTSIFEPLGINTSIVQAEIYAINRCALHIHDRGITHRRIAILSDSQAAVRALTSHEVNSGTAWECLTTLNKLGEANKVKILWVPSHSGVKGNEEADSLVKKGANTPFIESVFGIEPKLLKRISNEDMIQRVNINAYSLGGHCKLRAHLSNIGLEQTKTCRFCWEEDETSIHILTNCWGLSSHRLKNLGQCQIKESECFS